MTNTTTLKTTQLWDLTHRALCDKQWSKARALLDDLGLRSDNRDHLRSAEGYGLVGPYTPVIQDRIDWVNSRADG